MSAIGPLVSGTPFEADLQHPPYLTGVLTIHRYKVDVTKREIRVPKREIEFLEDILERLKGDGRPERCRHR